MINFYKKAAGLALCTLVSATSLYAQQTVTGKVTGANGTLSGVTVSVVGTNRSTQTDVNGNFTIQAKNGDKLRFSIVGYAPQELTLSSNVVSISLQEDQGSIDEVIVTAMGIKKEAKSLGYSLQKVDGKELTQTNAPTVATGLMGKVSGLNISLSNGVEGGSQRVVIRGNTSLSGNNQPLYVIDGMPIDNNQIGSSGNDINKVDGSY